MKKEIGKIYKLLINYKNILQLNHPKYLCSNSSITITRDDEEKGNISDNYGNVQKKLMKIRMNDLSAVNKYHDLVLNKQIKPNFFQDLPLRCHGCGSYFHTDPSSPRGYVPLKKLDEIQKGYVSLHGIKCNSCYNMLNYSKFNSLYMNDTLFQSYLSFVKARKALVVYVIDITDMSGSVINDVFKIVGNYKKVFFVFNKLDLIPQDGLRVLALKHLKASANNFIKGHPQLSLLINSGVHLISCKTGYGIRDLIFNITDHYEPSQDIVIMGTSNTGKSTLFNMIQNLSAFINNSPSLPSPSTVSTFPGTTSNLIRSPIAYNYIHNLRRIYTENPNFDTDANNSDEYFVDTKIFDDLKSDRYEDQKEGLMQICKKNVNEIPLYHLGNQLFKPSTTISQQAWLYDTPSVLSSEQSWNNLTHTEMKYFLMTTAIHPKIFKIPACYTIYAANFVRLDVLSCHIIDGLDKVSKNVDPQKDVKIIVAMFCEHQLRSFVSSTSSVQKMAYECNKYGTLKVPEPIETRGEEFPNLKPVDVTIVGDNIKRCVSDICISTFGWFGIAAHGNVMVKLRVWTPDGKGVSVRTPSLVPQIIMFKGKDTADQLGKFSRFAYKFMPNIRSITHEHQDDTDIKITNKAINAGMMLYHNDKKELKLMNKELSSMKALEEGKNYKKLPKKQKSTEIEKKIS